IVGGDFNMMFPDTEKVYPIHVEDWVPGIMTPDLFPDGFTIACDSSYPTCRLLNQPYDPSDEENTQFYVIDGFIVSPNVTLNTIETLHEDFRNSDHNPVLMNVTLNPRN
ncbi:MAG: endonuclease, partial [Lachnospiraceae bacterium]|nr:endonuclease [Candidatus Equihabitans merdae]